MAIISGSTVGFPGGMRKPNRARHPIMVATPHLRPAYRPLGCVRNWRALKRTMAEGGADTSCCLGFMDFDTKLARRVIEEFRLSLLHPLRAILGTLRPI